MWEAYENRIFGIDPGRDLFYFLATKSYGDGLFCFQWQLHFSHYLTTLLIKFVGFEIV